MNEHVKARQAEIRAERIQQEIAVFLTALARGDTEDVAVKWLRARLLRIQGCGPDEIEQAVRDAKKQAQSQMLLKAAF